MLLGPPTARIRSREFRDGTLGDNIGSVWRGFGM